MKSFKSKFFKGYTQPEGINCKTEYKSDFYYSKVNRDKIVKFLKSNGWIVYTFLHTTKKHTWISSNKKIVIPFLSEKQYFYNAIYSNTNI